MPNAEFDDVYQLLTAAMPERQQEVADLLRCHSVGFRRTRDATGFRLDNGFGQVFYNDRTMQQLYLVSFLAWRSLQAYSGIIILLNASSRPFDLAAIASLPGQAAADAAIDHLANAFAAIQQAWAVADVAWPTSVPQPTLGRHRDSEDQAAQEIALLATTYVLLHEVHHIVLADRRVAPGGWQEELLCDAFARDFMLAKVNEYVPTAGVSHEQVRNKRAMAIALANCIYAEITPPALWGGSTHPPLADRFRANYVAWPLNEHASVWIYMACLVIARMRRLGRSIGVIPFATPKALCERLTDALV